jgi:Holliday junction resolvase
MADFSVEIDDLKKLLAGLINSQKETDAKFKETDARIKKAFDLFESQWGKLIESLVEGDLVRILQERGIQVHATSTRRKGSYGGENYEFDVIAHNGEEIVVVEVKTTLRIKHVNRFIERLNRVKTWLPEYKNARVYGAVAFLRADEESDIFAERQKLFAIRATGDSAAIVNQPGFVPRAF